MFVDRSFYQKRKKSTYDFNLEKNTTKMNSEIKKMIKTIKKG
jgi:hypothetical protein